MAKLALAAALALYAMTAKAEPVDVYNLSQIVGAAALCGTSVEASFEQLANPILDYNIAFLGEQAYNEIALTGMNDLIAEHDDLNHTAWCLNKLAAFETAYEMDIYK